MWRPRAFRILAPKERKGDGGSGRRRKGGRENEGCSAQEGIFFCQPCWSDDFRSKRVDHRPQTRPSLAIWLGEEAPAAAPSATIFFFVRVFACWPRCKRQTRHTSSSLPLFPPLPSASSPSHFSAYFPSSGAHQASSQIQEGKNRRVKKQPHRESLQRQQYPSSSSEKKGN